MSDKHRLLSRLNLALHGSSVLRHKDSRLLHTSSCFESDVAAATLLGNLLLEDEPFEVGLWGDFGRTGRTISRPDLRSGTGRRHMGMVAELGHCEAALPLGKLG